MTWRIVRIDSEKSVCRMRGGGMFNGRVWGKNIDESGKIKESFEGYKFTYTAPFVPLHYICTVCTTRKGLTNVLLEKFKLQRG